MCGCAGVQWLCAVMRWAGAAPRALAACIAARLRCARVRGVRAGVQCVLHAGAANLCANVGSVQGSGAGTGGNRAGRWEAVSRSFIHCLIRQLDHTYIRKLVFPYLGWSINT